jgi:xylan 1,4-beta-xylosidase
MSSGRLAGDPSDALIDVRADLREPLRRIWRYVGYDEPNYTYTPDGRSLLAKLGRMSDAPYFVRCHFLLCSGDGTGRPKWGSTNVYAEDAGGNPVYSWEIVDRILDAYVETGCVPFIEIGFMPQALSTAPPDLRYDDVRRGGWRFPPRDYGRWMDLVRALAAHCLGRYGLREVSRWYWELWNEPDIFYWQGTTSEYCRLYDYTVAGLLSALPQARVGGPATTSPGNPCAGEFLRSFLAHCVAGTNAVSGQRGSRLDFVSFHTKGGGYRADKDAPKQTPTIHTLVRHVAAGLGIVDGFPELSRHELVLSECDPDGWAAGSVHENPNLFYRNTEYYASYLACAVCKLIDLSDAHGPQVDGMLTWAFQFENRGYFEGLRTLSTNGIDKPVLNVFRMLSSLGSTRLHLVSDRSRDPLAREGGDDPNTLPDLSGIAAINGHDEIQILLSSHHDDWDVHRLTRAEVRLSGLGAGKYAVYCTMIDGANGNAHSAWLHMGEPQQLSQTQRLGLEKAAKLTPQRLADVTCEGGRDELSVTLSAHGVCLLRLVPVW